MEYIEIPTAQLLLNSTLLPNQTIFLFDKNYFNKTLHLLWEQHKDIFRNPNVFFGTLTLIIFIALVTKLLLTKEDNSKNQSTTISIESYLNEYYWLPIGIILLVVVLISTIIYCNLHSKNKKTRRGKRKRSRFRSDQRTLEESEDEPKQQSNNRSNIGSNIEYEKPESRVSSQKQRSSKPRSPNIDNVQQTSNKKVHSNTKSGNRLSSKKQSNNKSSDRLKPVKSSLSTKNTNEDHQVSSSYNRGINFGPTSAFSVFDN